MITNELLAFIREQQAKGISDDNIKALLLRQGSTWTAGDLTEAFSALAVSVPKNKNVESSTISFVNNDTSKNVNPVRKFFFYYSAENIISFFVGLAICFFQLKSFGSLVFAMYQKYGFGPQFNSVFQGLMWDIIFFGIGLMLLIDAMRRAKRRSRQKTVEPIGTQFDGVMGKKVAQPKPLLAYLYPVVVMMLTVIALYFMNSMGLKDDMWGINKVFMWFGLYIFVIPLFFISLLSREMYKIVNILLTIAALIVVIV